MNKGITIITTIKRKALWRRILTVRGGEDRLIANNTRIDYKNKTEFILYNILVIIIDELH